MPHFPTLFVSHGAPTLITDAVPARDFLAELGQTLTAEFGRPKAVLVVSAHWETARVTLSTAARPETIHDFYGFPEALYDLRYPAPGAPELAAEIAARLKRAGIDATTDDARGLDHGAWVPLMLMYDAADIPAFQLSVQPDAPPEDHLAVGRALAELRDEGVLILASGSFTHNLPEFRGRAMDSEPPEWVREFRDWAVPRILDRRDGELAAYREAAPHGVRNHPTEEHFLPLFVALGAAEEGKARHIHASTTFGVLAMDGFRFD